MLHSIGIIAVAAIVTLFIRAIPFVLFGGKREVPATVTSWEKYSRRRSW